jgi:hypothetical protein
VKAAAAVLAASLLFFVGVLTGAGRREPVSPPTAIPLGVVSPEAAASDGDGARPGRSPSPPRPPRTTARMPATGPATPTTASTVTTSTTVTTNPNQPEPGETTTTTSQPTGTTIATTGNPATSTTTSSSARSGDVEEVDGEVDCTSARRGKGKREPCESTTATSSRDGSGGRGNR